MGKPPKPIKVGRAGRSGSGVNALRRRIGCLTILVIRWSLALQFTEVATVWRKDLGSIKVADMPAVIGPELVTIAVAEIVAAPGPKMGFHSPALPHLFPMIKDVIIRNIPGNGGQGCHFEDYSA